jgi:hypothetical protein
MKVSFKTVLSAFSIAALAAVGVTTHFVRPASAQTTPSDYIGGSTSVPRNTVGTYYAGSTPTQYKNYTWSCTGGTIVSTYNQYNSGMSWRAPATAGTYYIRVQQAGVNPAAMAVTVN